MSTIVIDVDDKSSAKLFLDLARKLQLKAKIMTEQQKEDWALLSIINDRSNEPSLPIESTLAILTEKLK
jgi:hypothetical protein